jgi:Kef-type K+ transport system membrane component KefB
MLQFTDLQFQGLLSSIGICVGAAALDALLGYRLRQPLILAYLLTGVLIGPVGLNLVKDRDSIQTVAEIGLILLLFIIGLEIDLKKLVAAGAPVLLTGALQVPLCFGLGLLFFYWLGFRVGHGNFGLLYLAACMSMSSTLIVVKLLYDKLELDTLPGRITLGVLVVQDLWAVAMLAVQPNLSNPDFSPLLASLLKGVLLVVWSLAVARYILPRLFRSVAKAPELVLVSALAWCFFLAAAASVIGLSREMGALIAGVSLSTFPYNLDVIAKAANIRDFFVTLFFVALGMQIPIPQPSLIAIALAASLFLTLSRLVVVPILYALRLGHRASLIPAINLAQISEFSIVIASIGLARGQIGPDVVTVVILTFAVTSVTSTYLVANNHALQEKLSRVLRLLHVPDLDTIGAPPDGPVAVSHDTVILLGFFRDASSILQELEQMRPPRGGARVSDLLVIDFNPNVIGELGRRGIRCVYGDVAHIDTLQHAHIAAARLVVSTITDDILRGTSNLRILKNVRRLNPSAHVVVATDHIPQALALYEAGADFVYVPRLHSAREMARMLQQGLAHGFEELRAEAIQALTARHEVLA